MSMVCGYWRY